LIVTDKSLNVSYIENELRSMASQVDRMQVSTGIDKCRAVNYNAWHRATDF